MNGRELNINEGLEIANKAKDLEKNLCYNEAAQKYKEAREFFKKIGEDKLFAKCLAAHAENMIKYYLSIRDIEAYSHNIIDFYIKKIKEIKSLPLKLSKLDIYDISITEFHELEKIFKNNYMNDLRDKVYYEKTKLYHRQFWEKARNQKNLWQKSKNILYSILHLFFNIYCGHGALIIRPIGFSLSIVFLFSLFFCCFSLIDYANPTMGNPIGWLQSLYFSVITFTTLGFGDIIPINCIGQALATIEVMLGYLLLGTLIAILIRRITR